MTDRHLLLTPEKVVLSLRYCGAGTRAGAHLVDLALAFIIAIILGLPIGVLAPVLGGEAVTMLSVLATLLTILGYFVGFEYWWHGQTPGKRMVRARVILVDGTPVTFSAVLYRNILRPADFLPGFYLLGILCLFMNPNSQRLGDLAAGTLVIVEPPHDLSYTPAPHHVGVHRFESSVGSLKRMTLEEYRALKALCDRFPALPPETQAWSVENIWKPFAARQGIEPVEGSSPLLLMEAVVMKFGRTHNLA